MSLRVLIAVTLLPAALVMGQADASPEAVVGRLVEAARNGNAAGIKLLLAPGSAGSQTTINRWADDLAKAGPNLPADQLVDPQQSLIAGDFAVVRGGPPPGTLTRLRKINNQWKILIPGDAAANYGLDRMVALNLSSLEKRAEREWKDAPAPTAPSQNGSTATPGAAPDNTAPADNADPVRHPNNPAITRALPEFVAIVRPMKLSDPLRGVMRSTLDALLDAGEVAAAEQVFRAAPQLEAGRGMAWAGELAVRSPGGVNGPTGRELLALVNARPNQFGTMEGTAFGLARMGQHREAADMVIRQPDLFLGPRLIKLRPHSAYLPLLKLRVPAGDPGLVRALLILGQNDRADEAAQLYMEKQKALGAPGVRQAELDISAARFAAMLYRGEFDQAANFPDQYDTAAMQPLSADEDPRHKESRERSARIDTRRLRVMLIAAIVLRGDLETVNAAIATPPARDGGPFDPVLLAAHAYARHGDEAGIERLLQSLNARRSKGELEHAVLFGLVVHAAHAAGNADLVDRYAEQFMKHIEGNDVFTKTRRLDAFLQCAARGPTGALRVESYDAFPLD